MQGFIFRFFNLKLVVEDIEFSLQVLRLGIKTVFFFIFCSKKPKNKIKATAGMDK